MLRSYAWLCLLRLCLLVGLVSLAVTPASGQTVINWSNPAGGDYNLITNWSPFNIPNTAMETARFSLDATFETSFNAGASLTIADLLVLQGDVTFLNGGATNDATLNISGDAIIDGGILTLARTTSNADVNLSIADNLAVGNFGTGILNVEDGGVVTNMFGYLGNSAGSNGTATVTGGGSQWNNSSVLRVGNSGTGTLNVAAGGMVSNTIGYLGLFTGSTGTATVTGSGSQWNSASSLYVGESGTGTLSVAAGGVVSNTLGYLGLTTGSSGTATVTGSGSQWNNSSELRVGNFGTGTLNVEAGGVVSNTDGIIGLNTDSIGTATVTGGGSQWNNSFELRVGFIGTGTLNVEAGGVVSNTFGDLGFGTGSTGTATVTGGGSEWNNSSELRVGYDGTGTLNVEAGGVVGNTVGIIGLFTGSTGTATVTGGGSQWNNSADLSVGRTGTGTLNVEAGGVVSNTFGNIGFNADSTGTATVTGNGSEWNSDDNLLVGNSGTGTLNVADGGVVTNTIGLIGYNTDSTGTATVTGSGSEWTSFSGLRVGGSGTGTLNVADGGVVANTIGYIGRFAGSTGTATVTGSDSAGIGSKWTNSGNLYVGDSGTGTLNVEDGGVVSNTFGLIGNGSSSTGTATVTGSGSQWNNSGDLFVGFSGTGTLNVEAGGVVSNALGYLGTNVGSTGTATVTGGGSQWNNIVDLSVGNFGTGTLNVEAGGVVSNMLGYLGINVGSSGTATVTGSGSQWNNSGNLYVGGNESAAGGTGSLTITDDGLVDVDGTLKIWDQGTVILDGGSLVTQSFDRTEGGVFNFLSGSLTINDGLQIGSGTIFPGSPTLNSDRRLATAGTTTIAPFRTLTLDGGTLETGDLAINGTLAFNSGTLGITGVGGLTVGAAGPFGMSLSVGSGQNLDVTNTLTVDAGASLSFSTGGNVSAATIANGGVVQGRGNVSAALANQSGGLVRVQVGDLLTFANPTHTNDGDFQLQGGRIDFVGTLTNNAGGNILGRGTLSTTGGLTNLGDLALSNGQTDVFGDVDNQSTGRVIVSGNADVTFWDDVTDSGALFNVSTGSSATFFGTAGFGIAGGGDVFFEADVTPGSSPGLESFGGNVHFGVLANLEIELAGTTKGAEYDALDVVGIASLGGTLDVSLLGVFTPSVGDKFEIVSASGGVSGIFATLAEDLPVLVGGLEWAIDYGANNVVLNVVSAGLAGDYNGNGTVDAADYTVWRNNLGSLAALPNDDTAGVGPDDYVRWKQHYGETATGSGGIAQLATHQVPEPTAGLLLLIAVSLPGRRIRQVGTQPPR